MRRVFVLVCVALSGACATGAPGDAGSQDPGVDARVPLWPDSGGADAGAAMDAGVAEDAGAMGEDAGRRDAGTPPMDAGSMPDAGRDAGTPVIDAGPEGIVVDGVIGALEWASAEEASSSTVSIWEGSELRRLLATIAGGRLFIAVEGRVTSHNAIVIYVDGELGGAAGVADLSSLEDSEGSLDNAVSAGFVIPPAMRPDYAWGTQDMGRAATGISDARMGWRDIDVADPNDFAWIDPAGAPTVCSASACETSIQLATLGGTSPRTVALFARITNSDGTLSPNQTLPQDDDAMPRTVSVLMELTE